MSTTSRLVTVKKRLVTKYTTALGTSSQAGGQLQVLYGWRGADMEAECVFLGRRPVDVNDERDGDQVASIVPNIKAGRKQRQESFEILGTLQSHRPDLEADGQEAAEERALLLFGEIEDVHADETHLGIRDQIQQSWITEWVLTSKPADRGWSVVIPFVVRVEARLS